MFSGPATRFLASGFPILFGDPQNQRRAETPEISNFVPSHLASSVGSYDYLDFIDEMNKTNPSPSVLNKYFVRGQVETNFVNHRAAITQAASAQKFLSEVNRPIDAIAFIGHALETRETNPPVSIGIMFYYSVTGPLASTLFPEIFPTRDLTPNDICGPGSGFPNCLFPLQKDATTMPSAFVDLYTNLPAFGAPPFTNSPPMGQLIDRIPSQAKIVFIGACEIQDQILGPFSPFLQMWDIHNLGADANGNPVPATPGRAMIAPLSSKPGDPQGTHLGVAARVWIRILENLIGHSERVKEPMTVKDAVNEANDWAHKPNTFLTPLNPSDTWQVIGDPTVRLR